MKRSLWSVWLFLFFLAFGGKGWCAAGTEHAIRVDAGAHQKFGLYYPVTYKFDLPESATALTAQYRYAPTDTWKPLAQKSRGDLFNGIDAVRFEYPSHVAYASVRFSRSSNDIYLRFLDPTGKAVPVSFNTIPFYYDNRNAAVT